MVAKKIKTSDIAKTLNTTNNVIIACVRRILPDKVIVNGKPTFFNEKEVSLILQELKKNSTNNRSVALTQKLDTTTTLLEENEKIEEAINILQKRTYKLTESLQKTKQELADTKQLLLIEHKKNEELQEKQDFIKKTAQEECTARELWAELEKMITKKAESVFLFDYKRAFNYYYSKFKKQHPYIEKINKTLFKKNKQYAIELKNIILSDF